MPLARLIEQLLSTPQGDGFRYHQEVGFVDTVFPPFSTVTLNTAPNGGDYGRIVYRSSFDPCMVPNAISVTATYYGNRVFTGTLNGYALMEGIDYFIFMSLSQPARISISNLTNVNQYVRMCSYFLNMRSEDDVMLMKKIAARMSGIDAAELVGILEGILPPWSGRGGV